MPGTVRTIGLLGVTRERFSDEKLMNDAQTTFAAVSVHVSGTLRVCITCEATGRSYCLVTGDPTVHMIEAD
jgi:hypothetical protein